MKKLDSTIGNMAIVLTVVSVVAAGILAYVNQMTAPQIEKIKAENLAAGIQKVLVAEAAPVVQKVDTMKNEKGDITAIIYNTDKGAAVQSTDPNGFGGNLTILVGFDEAGSIKGYQVLETAETPGLGAKASTWFQKDGKGNIIGKNPGEKELVVSKDGGDVDAITASTITSRAFLRAIKNPEILDLCLVGVEPEYLNRGVSGALSLAIMQRATASPPPALSPPTTSVRYCPFIISSTR